MEMLTQCQVQDSRSDGGLMQAAGTDLGVNGGLGDVREVEVRDFDKQENG
jgi:hypothetical protein